MSDQPATVPPPVTTTTNGTETLPDTKIETSGQPTTSVPPPAQRTGGAGGPVDPHDVDDWKNRFNTLLAKPADHVNSKSHASAGSWTNSIFSCFSPVDTCLITCCVPCVTFGKTHHRLRKNGNLEGYEPINTSCLLLCGANCVGVPCIPMAMQRQNIREKYNLQGDCITDLLLSFCCGCCALIQSDKEAEHHEKLLAAHAQQTQYQSNADMTFPTK